MTAKEYFKRLYHEYYNSLKAMRKQNKENEEQFSDDFVEGGDSMLDWAIDKFDDIFGRYM